LRRGKTVLEGHPIQILMEEHRLLLEFADEPKKTAEKMGWARSFETVGEETRSLRGG